MAIKISSIEKVPLPLEVKDSLVSLSGGWSATPDSGGIITLNGNATFVETRTNRAPVSRSSKIIDLGVKIGTELIITGYSESEFIGYTKKSVSFTDKLGAITSNRSPSKSKRPLLLCVDREKGANQAQLISRLLQILNIPGTFPRMGSQQFYEPVWAKDNQAIVSLLNEMLVTTGCVMYCDAFSGKIKIETIGRFFEGLKGEPSGNTLSSTTYFDSGLDTNISNFLFRGSTQKVEILDNPPDTVLDQAARKSFYSKTAGDSKVEVEEQYENSLGSLPKIGAENINECYPIDTGRIVKRVTTEFLSNNEWMTRVWESARSDYYNSCNLDESLWPTSFASGGNAWIPIKISTETWEYNTDSTIIAESDTKKSTMQETVKYTMIEESCLYLSNQAEATIGLGVNFSEYLDPEGTGAAGVANYFRYIWTEAISSFTSQRRDVTWTRNPGSYKWVGVEDIRTGTPTTEFNSRRGKIEQLKVKMDSGKITINDPADFITALAPYTAKPNGTRETGGQQRNDWNPEYSVFPARFKIVTQPWMTEETAGFDGGDILTIDGGIYMKHSELLAVSRDIAEARNKRKVSLSITDINNIFPVGAIDAPSFSLDVDGITTSGVFLNG